MEQILAMLGDYFSSISEILLNIRDLFISLL